MEECCLLACRSWIPQPAFLYLSMTTYPRMALSMFNWVLLHQSLVKKFLQVCSEASMGGEAFS